MKKVKILITTALVCCVMVCFAMVDGLSGKWTGTLPDPDGDGDDVVLTYVFKVDGDKLTGNMIRKGATVGLQIDSGKVDGNTITFTATNLSGGVIRHSGIFYGDSIGMNLTYKGEKHHLTLKRVEN